MEFCREQGLHQVDLNRSNRRVTNEEYRAGKRGQETLDRENEVLIQKGQKPKRTKFETEKEKIRQAIQKAVAVSHSPEEFQKILQEQHGIQVKESRDRWGYLPLGRTKPITGRKLGDIFEKAAILEAIQRHRMVLETEGSLLGAQKENMITFVHSGQNNGSRVKGSEPMSPPAGAVFQGKKRISGILSM